MTFGVFAPPFRPAFDPIGAVAAPPAANWWEVTGKTTAAAYRPKGAASYAASLSNLANPGTNDAAEGVAPSWSSGTGWTFNGSTQYLKTTFHPLDVLTVLIQFTDAVNAVSSTGAYDFRMFPILSGNCYFERGSFVLADAFTSGNIGMAGSQGYKDGTAHGAAMAGEPYNGYHILIGAQGEDPMPDGPVKFCNWTVQAWVAFVEELSGAEVATVAAAMAAL